MAVVQIQLDPQRTGQGDDCDGYRVRPDGDGGVLLDDTNEQLITLTDITRKASCRTVKGTSHKRTHVPPPAVASRRASRC